MRHIAATALTLAALAATLPSAAQTARLGSLPPSAQVVTNTSALQLTQAMLDTIIAANAAALTAAAETNAALLASGADAIAAVNATNAALTAAILKLTNGWAQYDTLVQQSNATVRLYQSETSLRWAWLTPTNLAVTTLTPVPGTESTNIVWSSPSAVPVTGATLRPVSGERAAIGAALQADGGYVTVSTAVNKSGAWKTGEFSYPADEAVVAAAGTAFHATGGSTVYAGFQSSSNLWRSADGGATWTACAAFPPLQKLMGGGGSTGTASGFYAGHIYSLGATVIAVPFAGGADLFYGEWFPITNLEASTNRWLRSADNGETWTAFAPDILWHNPAPAPEDDYRDFDMYASAFVRLHETSGGATINLNTWVHQSKLTPGYDVFHSTNMIRRLDGTNWTDHATLPSDMVNLRAAGGLYFGMPYSGTYHYTVTSQAAPRVSADLSAWQDTDLPARKVYDEPYEFFSSGGMWIAANGTNLWLSADGASWFPADRPEDASGAVHAAAGRLYIGAGASQVRTGVPGIVMEHTSATVTLPLWGDWQSDVSAAVGAAVPPAVAAAVGPLATTQQVAEAVGPLASTQQVAQALSDYLRSDISQDTGPAWFLSGGNSEDGDPAHRTYSWKIGTLGGSPDFPLLGLVFRYTEFGSWWGINDVVDTTYLLNPGSPNTIARQSDLTGKVNAQDGAATNLNLVSEWQTIEDATGSITLTNIADRPIQCSGTGAVTLSFSGLKPPQPVYLTLAGFDSVAWPTNAYAVGGWGAWQTNRVNHFAVWQVGTNIYVNPITTSEE